MSVYRGFEITRGRRGYVGRRATREAVYMIWPRLTVAALQIAIDEHWLHLPIEGWD